MAVRGLAELDSPLYHSFCGLEFVHHLLDGLVHYYDWIRLKIWTKLREATIRVNVIFSMCGYLALTP